MAQDLSDVGPISQLFCKSKHVQKYRDCKNELDAGHLRFVVSVLVLWMCRSWAY